MKNQRWLEHAEASHFPYLSGADVTIYPESHELFIDGKNVRCSRTHFRFLTALLIDFCKTVPYHRLLGVKERLLSAREQNLLKVQMFYLRRLLRKRRAQLEIRNIYGTGYQARPSR
jgi:DNA-binding response OmpR family regulator